MNLNKRRTVWRIFTFFEIWRQFYKLEWFFRLTQLKEPVSLHSDCQICSYYKSFSGFTKLFSFTRPLSLPPLSLFLSIVLMYFASVGKIILLYEALVESWSEKNHIWKWTKCFRKERINVYSIIAFIVQSNVREHFLILHFLSFLYCPQFLVFFPNILSLSLNLNFSFSLSK